MYYWQHQTDEPLYPDVIWSRPETKHGSGKLLIIGGSAGSMSHVAANFTATEQSGAGTIHLLVPDSLTKVTKGIPHIQYAPANPSGSFARSALDEFLSVGSNVDGVFLAGDLGKNSETSLLLEAFFTKYSGIIAVSSDSVESFPGKHAALFERDNTVIELTLNQLRNIAIELQLDRPVTSDIARAQLAEILHDISLKQPGLVVTHQEKTVWIAHRGRVVDCLSANYTFARCVVWAVQQPEKQFEAIVSSLVE